MPGGVIITEMRDTKNTSTLAAYLAQKPVDQRFNGNLLWGILHDGKAPGVGTPLKPNRIMRKQGGRKITLPVAYNTSSNTTSFRGITDVPLNEDEVATDAEAQWAYYIDSVVISKTDNWENRGEHERYDLLQARADQMMGSLEKTIDGHLFSTGDGVSVGNSGKNIMGLQYLFPANVTATRWNLSMTDYSWWQHQYNAAGDTFANAGLATLDTTYQDVSGTNGEDPPHLHLTTPAQWRAYATSVRGIHQIQTTTIGDRGFKTLQYMGVPIFFSGNVPTAVWFTLNMNYMFLVLQDGVDMTLEEGMSDNPTIAKIWHVYFSGQLGCEQPRRIGRTLFTG